MAECKFCAERVAIATFRQIGSGLIQKFYNVSLKVLIRVAKFPRGSRLIFCLHAPEHANLEQTEPSVTDRRLSSAHFFQLWIFFQFWVDSKSQCLENTCAYITSACTVAGKSYPLIMCLCSTADTVQRPSARIIFSCDNGMGGVKFCLLQRGQFFQVVQQNFNLAAATFCELESKCWNVPPDWLLFYNPQRRHLLCNIYILRSVIESFGFTNCAR